MKNTTAADFIGKLKALYPEFDEPTIRKILKRGCENLVKNAGNNDDILLHSGRKKVKVLIYNYNK